MALLKYFRLYDDTNTFSKDYTLEIFTFSGTSHTAQPLCFFTLSLLVNKSYEIANIFYKLDFMLNDAAPL